MRTLFIKENKKIDTVTAIIFAILAILLITCVIVTVGLKIALYYTLLTAVVAGTITLVIESVKLFRS